MCLELINGIDGHSMDGYLKVNIVVFGVCLY